MEVPQVNAFIFPHVNSRDLFKGMKYFPDKNIQTGNFQDSRFNKNQSVFKNPEGKFTSLFPNLMTYMNFTLYRVLYFIQQNDTRSFAL